MVKSHLFAKNELSEMQKTRFDSYDVMMTSSQMTFSIFALLRNHVLSYQVRHC